MEPYQRHLLEGFVFGIFVRLSAYLGAHKAVHDADIPTKVLEEAGPVLPRFVVYSLSIGSIIVLAASLAILAVVALVRRRYSERVSAMATRLVGLTIALVLGGLLRVRTVVSSSRLRGVHVIIPDKNPRALLLDFKRIILSLRNSSVRRTFLGTRLRTIAFL